MIRFKTMQWSHAFSYGPNNSIRFDQNPLLQLVGKNGHGKSSIALILEEVLFNKNSKGVKKADILNRNSGASSYDITLDFSVDSDDYSIHTVRGSTQKVRLTKNKEDISAHTATATYKLIESIIGMDHKTFTQLVYQSNAFSLEFLTATDTNRKKFLIDLLNLVRYTELCDLFKAAVKDTSNQLEVANMKKAAVDKWLDKFSKENLEPLEPLPEPNPEFIKTCSDELSVINEQLASVVVLNKKISQNNKYKEILAAIDISPAPTPTKDVLQAKMLVNELTKKITNLKNTINGIGPIITNCPECGQPVDSSHKRSMLDAAKASLPQVTEELNNAKNDLAIATSEQGAYDKYVNNQREWERYYGFIDSGLSTELLDSAALNSRKTVLENTINKYHRDLAAIRAKNADIAAHNAKVGVILSQLESMRSDHASYTGDLTKLSEKITRLQILVKAFGTSGLVAYKIECLVKDLEDITNKYLQDMSDGRFQISFVISSSDKLDVIITDNGSNIDISALSNGELARVNISTLLGIRKLIQSISDTRTNLLILDETIENLDIEGKEKLVEVLLKEEYLNTILVSHGWSHPLVEKLFINKNNNISRIE